MSKKDIQGKEDLQQLVNHFYSKAMHDPIIGFFFTQVNPIDLEEHAPKIADFWQHVLFGRDSIPTSSPKSEAGLRPESASMMNNMLKVHHDLDAKAKMQTGHFTRWLHLFIGSIDELFAGENAENLKKRATKMTSSLSDAIRSKRGDSRIGVETLN